MKNLFAKRKIKDLSQLFIGMVIVLLLILLSNYQFRRFDLTAEKRYSLSDSTKKILGNLKDNMLVTVYLEGNEKDMPVEFKRLRKATQEILREFRYYAKGNFEYRFVDPFENAMTDPELQKNIYYQ